MPVEDVYYAIPGHLVRRAAQIHNRIFEEEFEGAITPRQFALIVALAANPGVDQISLANIVAIDRSTIGGMIHRLSARGLVEHVRDPEDGRRKVLQLSQEGHRFLDRLSPRIDKVSRRLLEPLSAREQETLLHLLTKIVIIDDPMFPGYRERAIEALGQGGAGRRKSARGQPNGSRPDGDPSRAKGSRPA